MFNVAVEILIDKLCNMHGVSIGACDISSISVRTMTTQPGFQGTSISRIAILHSFGVRGGPQKFVFFVGKMATSPLPYRGSPLLQSGERNQKWPTSGQGGYLTPVVSGIPAAAERWAKSEVAHKWAKWLPHPCRIGDPRRCKAGGKIRSGPQVGKVATSPLPYRGSPPLQSGGQNQKWPTSGQSGYLTPAVSGVPAAAERGAKSEVAHKWAKWLPHPCRIGDPRGCRAGGKNRSGPQVGKLATSPVPYRGSPPLQSGRQNQKWPTSGQIGYLTPCRLGDPRRFKAGGKIRIVQKKSGNATSPLHCGGSLAKGTKSKVAELGARTKLWMCSPKEQDQKKNRTNDVCASKNTLKTSPRTILKKGGGVSKPPTVSDFSETPPPLAATSAVRALSTLPKPLCLIPFRNHNRAQ